MKATSVRQFATSSAGCFLLLVWFALTTSDQYVGLVQCGMSKKFLSGFLIAILLGMRQEQSYYYPQQSYSAPPASSYSSHPPVYIIPLAPPPSHY